MVGGKNIVAVIPARGSSKRIPKKNIRILAGKPLIAYTINAAKNSKLIDRIIVSTDDEEIAEIAKKYGAEVVKRPAQISTDKSTTESALIHVVKYLEEKEQYSCDLIVLLQPTSPLRGAKYIDKAIQKAIKTGADSVLSVCEAQHYYLKGSVKKDKYIPDYDKRPRSQDMPKKYRENGAVYVTKKQLLISDNNRLGGDIRAIIMDPVSSVDIDEEGDFEIIEQVMLGNLNKDKENLNISRIKMILFDVDGVFTDGSVFLDNEGNESVRFSRIDGKGIELLRKKGYILGVISSENSQIVKKRMEKLKIPEIFIGIKEKREVYDKLKRKYDLTDNSICFSGDDVQDISILKLVGISCCPNKAQTEVKAVCKFVSQFDGGNGFVRDVCNLFIYGGAK